MTDQFAEVEMILELEKHDWADDLLKNLNAGGGLKNSNKGNIHELRFGHQLAMAGVAPSYEIQGEGKSTIDFGFSSGDVEWEVELYRLERTQVAIAAEIQNIDADGQTWTTAFFSTDADDPRQSEEGETLKAVERICGKVHRNGSPHKFRMPAGQVNVLVIDMKEFLGGASDSHDFAHIGWGGFSVPNFYKRYWEGSLIEGVFSGRNPSKGAHHARERIHLLGFSRPAYSLGVDSDKVTEFVSNPNLVKDEAALRKLVDAWPLKPMKVIGLK